MANLEGRRVLCFVGDDYEDLELWYPKLRLEEAGAHVTLAGSSAMNQLAIYYMEIAKKKAGRSTKRAKEIAAATVNKQRRQSGEVKSTRKSSSSRKSSSRSSTSGARKRSTRSASAKKKKK